MIVEDKKSDIVSCSCKNFEWEGIPCRHMLHYLIFRKQYTKLPSKYILNRWTKGAKRVKLMEGSGVNMEDGGDRGLLVRRNELYQLFASVVDMAVVSVEGTELLKGELMSIQCRMKSQSIPDGSNNLGIGSNNLGIGSNNLGIGTRSTTITSPPVLLEPNKVRAKGSGKRIKGGKEKTMEQNLRKCHACNKWGQSHDKRNCPQKLNP